MSGPQPENIKTPEIDIPRIRKIIDNAVNGFISPKKIQELFDAAEIPRAVEIVVKTQEDAVKATEKTGFPLAMKVVGPIHKSDVGGVALYVENNEKLKEEFSRMMKIPDVTGILLQPMLSGTELFIGVKKEDKFGHLVVLRVGWYFYRGT